MEWQFIDAHRGGVSGRKGEGKYRTLLDNFKRLVNKNAIKFKTIKSQWQFFLIA
jgi:hypothetical protein